MAKLSKLTRAGIVVGVIGCLGVGGVIGSSVAEDRKGQEILRLAENNGYIEANAIYRRAEIDKLNDKLDSKEISSEEYLSEVAQIEDLDVEYYMSSDNISAQAKEEYTALKNDSHAFACVTTAALCITVASALTLLTLAYFEEKAIKTESTPATEQ